MILPPALSTVVAVLRHAWTAFGHVQTVRSAANMAGHVAHTVGLSKADPNAHSKPKEPAHGRPYRRR